MNPNLPKALIFGIKIQGFLCRLTSLKFQQISLPRFFYLVSKFRFLCILTFFKLQQIFCNQKIKIIGEKRQPLFKSGTVFGELPLHNLTKSDLYSRYRIEDLITPHQNNNKKQQQQSKIYLDYCIGKKDKSTHGKSKAS